MHTHKTLTWIGLSLLILTLVLVPAVGCLAAEPVLEAKEAETVPQAPVPGPFGGPPITPDGYVWGG
jgi:hypothetical protein